MSGTHAPQTHYQILGVPTSATDEQIKRAYRARAKTLHPDVSDAPDAAVRFARIAEAYEVLSDQARRRAYDRSLLKAQPTSGSKHDNDDPPESGFVQGHYAWVNVAAPKSATPQPAEIDDLYDTFFGSRSPEGSSNPGQPEDSKPRQRSGTPATPKRSASASTGRTPGASPESHSEKPSAVPRPKASRKNAG